MSNSQVAPPIKPDKKELEQQCEIINTEITQLQEKLISIKSLIEKANIDNSGSRVEIDAARAKLQKLYSEKNKLNGERSQLTASRDALKDALLKRTNEEKALRAEIKNSNLDYIENQINELETRQKTTSMSLQDEKKIIKDIKTLQQTKKTVLLLADLKAAIHREKEVKSAADKVCSDKIEEIHALNEQIAAQKAVLDEFTKGPANQKESFPALKQQEKEIIIAKQEKYGAIQKLKVEFKKAEDLYYQYLKEEKKRKMEIRQKEIEARKLEEEEKQKALLAEELAKIPYEDEMKLCDYLVQYLEKAFPVEPISSSPATANGSANVAEEVAVTSGMRVLQREFEDYTIGDTKKRGKKKGGNNSKKTGTISHSVDTLEYFSLLDIPPPSTVTAVATAIESLKAKKVFYQGTERGAIPSLADRNAAAARTKNATNTSKESTSHASKFSLEQDFPTLGGPIKSEKLVE